MERVLEIARSRIVIDPKANKAAFDAAVQAEVARQIGANARNAGKTPRVAPPKGSITNLPARPPGARAVKDPDDMDNAEFERWADSVNRPARRKG